MIICCALHLVSRPAYSIFRFTVHFFGGGVSFFAFFFYRRITLYFVKKRKNPSASVHKTIGSNNYFTLIENNFRFLI